MTAPDALAPQIANNAAEAIRALNHATLPFENGDGLCYPSDAYRTLGGLATLAARLPQSLGQIETFLVRELRRDHITIDAGEFDGDAIGAIATAARELTGAAARAASQLEAALDRAQQAIAFASYRETEPERL